MEFGEQIYASCFYGLHNVVTENFLEIQYTSDLLLLFLESLKQGDVFEAFLNTTLCRPIAEQQHLFALFQCSL